MSLWGEKTQSGRELVGEKRFRGKGGGGEERRREKD